MSPLRDPVVLAGGVLWVLSGLLAVVVLVRGLWLWAADRRRRRREALAVTVPRSFAQRLELDGVLWEDWPDRP